MPDLIAAGFGPVVPLVFGLLHNYGGDIEHHWLYAEFLKKCIYGTQMLFLLR